jgi:hypothetical protein
MGIGDESVPRPGGSLNVIHKDSGEKKRDRDPSGHCSSLLDHSCNRRAMNICLRDSEEQRLATRQSTWRVFAFGH